MTADSNGSWNQCHMQEHSNLSINCTNGTNEYQNGIGSSKWQKCNIYANKPVQSGQYQEYIHYITFCIKSMSGRAKPFPDTTERSHSITQNKCCLHLSAHHKHAHICSQRKINGTRPMLCKWQCIFFMLKSAKDLHHKCMGIRVEHEAGWISIKLHTLANSFASTSCFVVARTKSDQWHPRNFESLTIWSFTKQV